VALSLPYGKASNWHFVDGLAHLAGSNHAVFALAGLGQVPGQIQNNHRTQKRRETMKVTPLSDRILVRRMEATEEKRGGIIIPDTAKEKPQQGEIIAVGPGRMTEEGKRVAPEVKRGQKVLIGKYSGTEVKIDGKEYIILREEDILGIVG
jgi:chaperonin GroES